jgi:hypothetical protein
MAKKKKEEVIEKEEVKVVDEVTIEETVEETPVEEVKEEVVVEAPKEEVVVEAPKEEKKASKGKGKVVSLTQRTATFADGTIVRFNGRKEHKKYKALM